MRLARLFLVAPFVIFVTSSATTAQIVIEEEAAGTFIGQIGPPGRPARDARPEKPGTAGIRGRVVAAEGGSPIRRAQVRIMGGENRAPRVTTTDAQGRYELKELQPGRYNVSVAKAGFVSTQYGQQRPLEAGKPIELADGRIMEKVDFSMARAGVITGRVVDEFGDPVAEVMVTAMRYAFMNGERRLVPAGRPIISNDIGQFRIYGLPPGDYYVSANARGGVGFIGGESEDRSGYAPTYYPGTSNLAEAQRIALGLGQELTTGELTLTPIRTVKVSGTVSNSHGAPMSGAFVTIRPDGDAGTVGMMFSFRANAVMPDGSFAISNVAPGNYVIEARQNGRRFNFRSDDSPNSNTNSADEAEFASQPIVVGTDDLTGLTLIASRGATVLGQIVFEGDPPTGGTNSMRVFVRPAQRGGPPMDMQRPNPVRDDSTFEIKGLNGRGTLGIMNAPSGWSLKAILVGANDLTDTPMDFRGSETIRDVQIVLTNRVTEVSGTAVDGRGRPLKDFSVLAFAENSTRWQSASSRFVKTARPDQDGRFKLSALPPEDYLIIAVDHIPEGEWNNPDYLERLRSSAMRIRLDEGEKKSVDLKLSNVS